MKVKSLIFLAVVIGSLAYSATALQQPDTHATVVGQCCSALGYNPSECGTHWPWCIDDGTFCGDSPYYCVLEPPAFAVR
jgi:hypothetical protein